MSGSWHVYADDATLAALERREGCVLLVGSYMGYSNFGDILQLKGALRWHRANTGATPILVLDIDSITDETFTQRVRESFGVEGVFYYSRNVLEGLPCGLRLIRRCPRVPRLHLYGGGILNSMWGDFLLSLVEGMHERFGVGLYVVSGQQIEPAFREHLAAHFSRCPPAIAGGRDPLSAAVLEKCALQFTYSFDDAAECAQDLARALVPSGPGGGDAHALIHMNASGYTRSEAEHHRLETLLRQAQTLRERLGSRAVYTLVQAYCDRRTHEIADTLGVVQLLDDRWPMQRYDVLHLDRAAMDLDTRELPSAILPPPTLALTSSYHVTMLWMLAGIPCRLDTANEYYDQKRSGLGLGARPLEEFLANPTTGSLSLALEAREEWLSHLRRAWGHPVRRAEPRPDEATDAPRAWVGRRSGAGACAELRMWVATLERAAQDAQASCAALTNDLRKAREQSASLSAQVEAGARDLEALREQLAAARAEVRAALERASSLGEQLDAARDEAARTQRALTEELHAWRRWAEDLETRVARCKERITELESLERDVMARLGNIVG